MSKSLDDIDPSVRDQFSAFWNSLKDLGPFMIWETRRDLATQQAAFKAGNSKRDGIRLISAHQAGLAMDVVIDDNGNPSWDYRKFKTYYDMIGVIADKRGLEWGGSWEPKDPKTGLGWDPAHVQVRGA